MILIIISSVYRHANTYLNKTKITIWFSPYRILKEQFHIWKRHPCILTYSGSSGGFFRARKTQLANISKRMKYSKYLVTVKENTRAFIRCKDPRCLSSPISLMSCFAVTSPLIERFRYPKTERIRNTYIYIVSQTGIDGFAWKGCSLFSDGTFHVVNYVPLINLSQVSSALFERINSHNENLSCVPFSLFQSRWSFKQTLFHLLPIIVLRNFVQVQIPPALQPSSLAKDTHRLKAKRKISLQDVYEEINTKISPCWNVALQISLDVWQGQETSAK